jgi:hypothetical protein
VSILSYSDAPPLHKPKTIQRLEGNMLREVQPFQAVFIGTVAFFIALQWGSGIKRVLKGEWATLGSAIVLSAAMALIVFGDKNDPRFLPPQTTIDTWLVVGIIFAVTILANLIVLPLLSRSLSESMVGAVSVTATLFLFGVALYGLGRWDTDLDNGSRAAAIFSAYVLFGIGIICVLRGIWMFAHREF